MASEGKNFVLLNRWKEQTTATMEPELEEVLAIMKEEKDGK